ncbi:unnamed protein product [Cylindrotheca closterium]|uniref:Transcription-repair-coupling factor n=1 Tax=Cylindrotheca closterium TaxID=2856 RepID=A0AAD2JHW1_9STRA|nr:unnamed protein product [Cylindrotheca closterium]
MSLLLIINASNAFINSIPSDRRQLDTQLYNIRKNTRITFGSDQSVDGSDEEEAYVKDRAERDAIIEGVLKEQDEEFKEERRKKRWGEFADAKTKEDILKVEEKIKEAVALENQRKAALAQTQGVDMEVLEPVDTGVADDNGNIQIKAGSTSNWYNQVDEELQEEWKALESGSEGVKVADGQNEAPETVEVDGKIVTRDTLQGVRVGSAGGWSLEVFPGDFVVHRKYGIGRFERTCLRSKSKLTEEEKEARDKRRTELLTEELKNIAGGVTPAKMKEIQAKFGTEEDTDPISNPQSTVLEVAYADGIVHVPVDRAYRLSRYRSGDAAIKPKLSKVRGDAWRNARRKVEESTLELAQDVLALYATRETLQRPPFNPAKEEEVKEFGTSFRFEPTPDQKRCFEEVENDMVWRSRPMDRLICGDVGFGKTEVAMRALHRAVTNGRQAIFLAPTGVLASQHFKNVVKRMGEDTKYGKKVALLRGGMGKTSKAGKELRQRIAQGEVEIIVGTHALLSRDMKYKDLGLLIVDEEQRFGVKQKERLKVIYDGIDVLTLTATPIPRTLQMSLSGIRDTSTIRSPPPMRKATKTYVQDFNRDIVQLAIQKELDRGGQCYYVVPRIALLDAAEEMIRECFPDIRVIQAHGRMGRTTAEDNVSDFAEGNYDILLATTVIENGVDIPAVNTIIIQDSQNFGISTLYQLRGRVGRSDLQGYSYFLHREESITEQAAMRLQAIGELNELGSGFDVANRDLEIRGAGSLLGTEQSGIAMRVGFDLYMRMLKKSIRQLRGLDLPLVPRTNVILPKKQGSLSGENASNQLSIPEDYIPDGNERMTAESAGRLAESSAKLVELTNGWKKKYGPLPANLQTKLKTLHLHACTRRLGIDLIGLVDNGDGTTDCVMRSPGLRPRHLGIILPLLPKGLPVKGVDVVFPERLVKAFGVDEVHGGKKVDLKALLDDPSLDEDSESWDALDEEEIEAMKEISSAFEVKNMDDVDIEQYPRFVMKDFGTGAKAVDKILQVLLPYAKVVLEKQESEKDSAKAAAELRERRELVRQNKKVADKKKSKSAFVMTE